MQCPNCRKIEKGQWLYASGSRPFPEFSMDDWAHDEDLYDLSYTEMVRYGVQVTAYTCSYIFQPIYLNMLPMWVGSIFIFPFYI